MCVARLYKRKLGQVLRLFNGRAGLEQPGTDDGRELLAKQAYGMAGHMCGCAVAQCQINICGFEVYRYVGGINAYVDVRVFTLKSFEYRRPVTMTADAAPRDSASRPTAPEPA